MGHRTFPQRLATSWSVTTNISALVTLYARSLRGFPQEKNTRWVDCNDRTQNLKIKPIVAPRLRVEISNLDVHEFYTLSDENLIPD